MNKERTCLDCGGPLPAHEPQPVCPRCIFQRFAKTGSTVFPPETSPASGVSETGGRDFHAEYELLGEIGRGGMGVIYKAHQPRLNRVVAIKVIHAAALAGDAARRRFEAEMQTAGRLNHPNIVPVFDTGAMDGSPCFAMEYFAGGTLAARIKEFTAASEHGVRLLVKVARAVSFAHQRGVLHRDLKPANILLDEAGEPHVADFGLAKQLDLDSDLTRSGAVLGSPNYMSPEQAAGKSESLTVATDIYSLGVMLYEMLTGRPPFVAGTPLETMRLVMESEAPRPSTMVAHVNRDLETICLKCLRKEPERRYRTPEELADDLERWLRHEPIQARLVTGVERFHMWARRHPALATVSALFIVVLIAGFTAVTWQWRRAEKAQDREMQERLRAERALAHSAVALAEAALREGNGPEVQAALATVPMEYRDETWTYLLGESDTSRLLPPIGIEKIDDLAADTVRASIFAAADRAGKIVIFNVRDGSRLLEFTPGFATNAAKAPLRLAFSKAGDRLAIGRGAPGGIVVHDTRDGRKLAEWAAPPTGQLEFSPDGTAILQTSANRRTTRLWNVADGVPRWVLDQEYQAAGFASDARYVVSYSWVDQLRLLNADDGTPVRQLTDNYFEKFAAQLGGNLVVAANPLGFVRGFDESNGRQRFEFQPHEKAIHSVAFLPGGELFLTAATRPDGRQALQCWDVENGRHFQTFNGGSSRIDALALHPLSGQLIVVGHEARVWDAAGLPPIRTIRSNNAHPSAVFWGDEDQIFAPSPNGRYSAYLRSLSGELSTNIWSPPGGQYGQPSVSADGRRAAIGRYNSSARIVVAERDGTKIRQGASLNLRRMMAHLRISPNGDRVAVVQFGFSGVDIFDVATGKPAVALEKPGINGFRDVAWLDGGKQLAGLVTTYGPRNTPGSVEQVVLWDTASGRIVRNVTNASLTTVACAAPDGRRFAEAGEDRKVRIRDGTTLEVLREFRVHNAPITALAWHPTRPILATASQDLVIRLWNLEDGARLEELRGPLSPPSVLSFSPGGTRLATAARDQVVRIWEPRSLTTPAAPK
jgi:eukaryotic-like serine/threonine-protein kinase